MKLQSQLEVDVEPFSEVRWARVERDLFAELDQHPLSAGPAVSASKRRRALGWTAAAAVAASLAAGVFAVLHPGRAGHWDDRLRLATTDSTSQFTLGESSLTVAPRSLVLVSGDDEDGIDVVLDRGMVTCEVAPRHGRPPFRVDAGEVRIRVVGTKFKVSREEGGSSVDVDVDDGAVEVTARGAITVLHAGEHWPVRPLPPPTARADSPEAAPAAPAAASGPVAASPPRSPLPVRPAHRRHTPATTSSAEGPTDLATPATPEPAAPPAAATSAEPLSAQEAFEAATRRERSSPDEAAAAYRQIAGSRTAWAQIALFALAQLESGRGNRVEATRLFNAYLTRYPHGINADDVRELLRRMR